METATLGVEQALGEMQKLVDESKHKDTENGQLRQAVVELRDELDAEREKTKVFMEYEDIILDPDAEKQWQKVSIRSGKTYKDILLRSQQLYKNTRPISVAAIVESALGFALSRQGWRQVIKDRYSEKLKEEIPDAE